MLSVPECCLMGCLHAREAYRLRSNSCSVCGSLLQETCGASSAATRIRGFFNVFSKLHAQARLCCKFSTPLQAFCQLCSHWLQLWLRAARAFTRLCCSGSSSGTGISGHTSSSMERRQRHMRMRR